MLSSFLSVQKSIFIRCSFIFESYWRRSASFLQSQFSNNLITSIEKSVTYGLWLDKKGHVLADSHILRIDSETYYIFSEHTNPQFIRNFRATYCCG